MNDQMLGTVERYLSQGGQMPIDLDELRNLPFATNIGKNAETFWFNSANVTSHAPFVSNTILTRKEERCGPGMPPKNREYFGLTFG